MEPPEIDARFEKWALSNSRGGYLPAFRLIRQEQPRTLGWCDLEDLIAIFSGLKEMPEQANVKSDSVVTKEAEGLLALFANLSIEH